MLLFTAIRDSCLIEPPHEHIESANYLLECVFVRIHSAVFGPFLLDRTSEEYGPSVANNVVDAILQDTSLVNV